MTIEPEHLDVHHAGVTGPSRPVADPAAGEGAPAATPLRDQVAAFERRAISDAVARARGNWAAAARDLGLHRSNLFHLAKRLGLRESPADKG